jgi:hypothetical protein
MSMNNSFLLPEENLLTASALTVSGGATPSVTSSARQVSKISKLQVFVANAGASTLVTVTIKGKPSENSTMEETLAVFTLGASGTASAKAGRYIEQLPSYIWAVATNADAVNAATITCTLNMFR